MSDPFTTIDIIRRQHVGQRPEDVVEPPPRDGWAELDELRLRIEALETKDAERDALLQAPAPGD
jgi:hypothetical protein